jgi:hypothetical protein
MLISNSGLRELFTEVFSIVDKEEAKGCPGFWCDYGGGVRNNPLREVRRDD